MFERLTESAAGVVGFKVSGSVSLQEAESMAQQIGFLIHLRGKRPIGILVDLSAMDGVELQARWEEMRFLQKHNLHIARLAVVGAHPWEKVSSVFMVAAALLQAETLYFQLSEIKQAWQWVRTSKHAMEPPPPRISATEGVWKDYSSEYMDV